MAAHRGEQAQAPRPGHRVHRPLLGRRIEHQPQVVDEPAPIGDPRSARRREQPGLVLGRRSRLSRGRRILAQHTEVGQRPERIQIGGRAPGRLRVGQHLGRGVGGGVQPVVVVSVVHPAHGSDVHQDDAATGIEDAVRRLDVAMQGRIPGRGRSRVQRVQGLGHVLHVGQPLVQGRGRGRLTAEPIGEGGARHPLHRHVRGVRLAPLEVVRQPGQVRRRSDEDVDHCDQVVDPHVLQQRPLILPAAHVGGGRPVRRGVRRAPQLLHRQGQGGGQLTLVPGPPGVAFPAGQARSEQFKPVRIGVRPGEPAIRLGSDRQLRLVRGLQQLSTVRLAAAGRRGASRLGVIGRHGVIGPAVRSVESVRVATELSSRHRRARSDRQR